MPNHAPQAQKAQTKRWLKNEYAVALRAAVEDEMDVVCTRDVIAASREMRSACTALVESEADTLPRAVLDADPQFCASLVGDGQCQDDSAKAAAKAAYAVTVRSQSVPVAMSEAARSGPGGIVARLVGRTINGWVHNASETAHALVMLHSDPALDRADPGDADDVVASEFYSLAAAVNASRPAAEVLRFGQMDVSANDAPADVAEYAQSRMGAGARLVLWMRGSGSARPLPEVGEPPLTGLPASAVRGRLMQMLVASLGDKEGSRLRAAVSAHQQSPRGLEPIVGAGSKGRPARKAGAASERAPRVKAKARDAHPEVGIRRAQECEVCGLFFAQMAQTLDATRAALALSKEAASRRQAQIDGVQKAQTRRWLKMEYGQNLAAALEERMDGICTSEELLAAACSNHGPEGDGGEDEEGGWRPAAAEQPTPSLRRPDERPFQRAACAVRLEARCGALVDEAADEMQRAALDGRDATACALLLPACSVSQAMAFNSTFWASAADAHGREEAATSKDEV